jgi:YVTN family beta-propeller protein
MQNFSHCAGKFSLASAFLCLLTLGAASANAQTVVATIPTTSNPGGIAIDSNAGLAYVAINGQGTVDVISETTNTIVGTISVGQDAESVAVNPKTSRLYVADSYTGDVYVVNTKNGHLVATIPSLQVAWLALNPVTNTIYGSNFGNTVYVIDGATNAVTASISVLSAQELAVNPATNKIYVSTGDPDAAILTVIDGNTNQVVTNINIPGSANTLYVGVDAAHNLIYASNANNTGDTAGSIGVINGANNTVATSINIPGEPSDVAPDPATRRVYVNNFNLNEVQIVNGVTNRLTGDTVPTGTNPSTSAIDTQRHLLYVANFGSDSVTVISTQSSNSN